MKLSLSVRVAEAPAKDRLTIEFDSLARCAVQYGYHAICMRPSVVGVQTPKNVATKVRESLDALGLTVSMATTDLAVPLNNDHGPDSLRGIAPHLDVVASLGCNLIRICMKHEGDIPWAERAADQARERGIRLAHQCHTDSLFETVQGALDVIRRVGRDNFGIIYEPANLMLCAEAYGPETLRRLRPHIMNVYVQNLHLSPSGNSAMQTRVRGEVRFDPIGLWERQGVDFAAVFDGLKLIGYDGFVTVHQAFADWTAPAEAARQSAQFLRSIGQFQPPLEARCEST